MGGKKLHILRVILRKISKCNCIFCISVKLLDHEIRLKHTLWSVRNFLFDVFKWFTFPVTAFRVGHVCQFHPQRILCHSAVVRASCVSKQL